MAQQPLGAQLAQMLAARGIDTIFGIPGVHNVELYRGLDGAGLTHVLARHEQGAGFMADGWARASGQTGVAFVITGPGLTNILTPMGQAYSDSVPMLVISACLDRADLGIGRGRLHEMKDQRAAAETVSAWSHVAMDAASAYRLVDRALAEHAAGRPRPCHIQVPMDVLRAMAPPPPLPPQRPAAPAPDGDAVAEAAQLLAQARKPMLVLGGGARAAAADLSDLATRLGAASVTTYAGRGLIPAGGLHLGSVLARPGSEGVIAEADLVLAIGTELSETDLWRDRLGQKAPMIRVDLDPASLSDEQGNTLPILADSGRFVSALLDALGPDHAPSTGWDAAEIDRRRRLWAAEVGAERPGIPEVAMALKAALPEDAAIYSDMTQFAYAAKEIWDMAAPGLWHHPCGFGTLGYALPAAIGGAVARKGAPTLAIAGDYGLQYTLPELGVAADLGLSLPVVIWDNGGLGEIEASMEAAQMAPVAVRCQAPEWQHIAAAYGAAYAAPERLEDLDGVVRAALSAGRPTLVKLTPALAR